MSDAEPEEEADTEAAEGEEAESRVGEVIYPAGAVGSESAEGEAAAEGEEPA